MWKDLATDRFVESCWLKPALRSNRADMSPATFIGLVGIWSGTLSVMLCIAILVRLYG